MLPHSILKLTLKIKEMNTEVKTAVLVAVAALFTTDVRTAAKSGSTCGGIGKTIL